MLPDLRIVIAAIVSTFVLTVGVGFYASSRLINEPKKSTDSLAALDSTPVNRIALSWPAPAPQSEPLALDFAVTAKALRNPVRDITHESPAVERPAEPQTPPVRTTATDLAVPLTEKPVVNRPEVGAPSPTEAVPHEVKPVETVAPDVPRPPAILSEAPKPAPEPDIRVAVQYPPILEFPPELQAPVAPATPVASATPVAPAVAATEVPSEPLATTGSIAPTIAETQGDAAAPAGKESEVRIASRPDPDDATASDDRLIEKIPIPKPAPKLKPAKAAAKKVAPKKVVRRPVRRAAPAAPAPVPNFFTVFGAPQP